jgi:hypothetical protein
MTTDDLLNLRLHNQCISSHRFTKPDALLSWMIGIQGQDYFGAKWSLGLRLDGHTDDDIEGAISKGKIIRTWPMRGTLHFVAAKDIYWLLDLVGPYVLKQAAPRYRQLELTKAVMSKVYRALTDHLSGNNLTRDEIAEVLKTSRIKTDGQQRLSHILQHAATDQLICFGKRKGNQFSFRLLEEVVEKKKSIDPEEALTRLTLGYFKSRGPATAADFIWWSGLPTKVAKEGIEAVAKKLEKLEINGSTFYHSPVNVGSNPSRVFLLPGFDEFLLAYKDRTATLESKKHASIAHKNGMFHSTVVIDGKVKGTWKRTLIKNSLAFDVKPFEKFSKIERDLIAEQLSKYAEFLQLQIKR